MKKFLKVFVIIIAILLFILAGIYAWQRDNINAIIDSFNYTKEELEKKIKENREVLEAELNEKYDIVGNFTEEEETKIKSGEMTVEEAIEKKKAELEEKLKNSGNSEGNSSTTNKNDSKNATGNKEKSSAKGSTGIGKSGTESSGKTGNNAQVNAIVSNRIVEFYSLKAYYLGQLGQLEAKAMADYKALPASKRGLVGKQEVVSKYMSVASSLMNECDGKVAALTASLESEIRAVGGDTSIIQTIRDTYENEKNLQKSYYMSMMK